MATILCIETTTSVCSVSLSRDGKMIFFREVSEGYVHAEKLMPFISDLLNEAGLKKKELDAVAVSSGPGSYTGLRIGVSTAKGLCYALDLPLISVSTLKSLAWNARQSLSEKAKNISGPVLFCPMIDARRMEVYTALFDQQLNEVLPVSSQVITGESFADILTDKTVYFTGDGAPKCMEVLASRATADFSLSQAATSASMCQLAEEAFAEGKFENLALFEPFYLKEYKPGNSPAKNQ